MRIWVDSASLAAILFPILFPITKIYFIFYLLVFLVVHLQNLLHETSCGKVNGRKKAFLWQEEG